LTDISYLGLQYPDGWSDKVFSIPEYRTPPFFSLFFMLSGGTALTVTASPVHVDFPSNDNPA
jgi:hypothetical protein